MMNKPTLTSDRIRILDNLKVNKKHKKRVIFKKYRSLSDYYQDYYSSSDEEEPSSLIIPNDSEVLPLLDLNKMVKKIKYLGDVIKLCNLPLNRFHPCNRGDLLRLKKVKSPLEELNQLIGMKELKIKMIYHVLYYCQDLHKMQNRSSSDEGDLMHTVVQGKPGSGKTTVAKIIAKIYLKLGILKSDKFIVAKRKDLIGEFLGHTAPKTTKVLESAIGGVLFIDEAYSLGNNDKQDIYSKECLDTLNEYLTTHKKDLVVIIAGYKGSLTDCFFSNNEGLERRFPWVYTIDEYDNQELREILIKKINDSGWKFEDDNPEKVIPMDFMNNNKSLFEFCGGDVETFLSKCKLSHSKNTFGLPPETKGYLTHGDIIAGLELHREAKNQRSVQDNSFQDMFL